MESCPKLMLILITVLPILTSVSSADFSLDDLEMGTLANVTFNSVAQMEAADDGKTVYASDMNAIWALDVTTGEKTLIAGSKNQGYVEGVGAAARFYRPYDMVIRDKTLYVIDHRNHCLRTVNLESHETAHYAGSCGVIGMKDGTLDSAKFSFPSGIASYQTKFLVAEYSNQDVRLVGSDGVSTVVKGAYQITALEEIDGEYYFTDLTALFKLDVEGKNTELVAGAPKTRGFVDGPLLSARFKRIGGLTSAVPGLILLTDVDNNKIRVVDLNKGVTSSICNGGTSNIDGEKDVCQILKPWSIDQQNSKIHIAALNFNGTTLIRTLSPTSIMAHAETCPPVSVNVLLKPDETAGRVTLPDIELMAPAGETKLVTKLSNGTSCNTTVNVIAIEIVCPSTLSAVIPTGATSVSVTWPLPSKNGIDGDEIECVSCPPVPTELPAGLHEIEYEYQYEPTQATIGCSFDVLVVPPEEECVDTSEVETCSSGLSKGKETTVFDFKSVDGNTTPIEFPVGTNTLEIVNESGAICTKTIKVHDSTPLRSSVDLVVKYTVDCNNLNPFSWAVINSSLLHHYTNLIYACQDCGLQESADPEIMCESGVLSAAWPTEITFPEEDVETDPWPAKRADLISKLMKVQEEHVKLTGRYFVITVIMQNPPVVPPMKGMEDLYAYPEVISSCPTEALVYDKEDDACYNQ